MDELLEQFLLEGRDLIVEAHRALDVLALNPGDTAAVDSLFRATHTLKGSVALFDMAPAETVLHAAETRLVGVRRSGMSTDPELHAALVATIDQVDRWIDALEAGGLPDGAAGLGEQLSQALSSAEAVVHLPKREEEEDPAWLVQLRARAMLRNRLADATTAFRYTPDSDCFFRGDDPLSLIAAVPELIAVAIVPNTDWPSLETIDPFRCIVSIDGLSGAGIEAVQAAFRLVPDQIVIAPLGSSAHAPQRLMDFGAETTLRVDSNSLDRLARQAGELTVARSGLKTLAARADAIDSSLAQDLRRAEAAIEQASSALSHSISAIRRVSLAPTLRRMPRLARELAESLGKDIGFSLVGDSVRADKQIADMLFEPLLHLLRNAIDHGVETPEARIAAGKSAKAQVALQIAIEGDRLIATMSDDGRGIDPTLVRAGAVEKALIEADAALTLSDVQAQRLIFLPGFSTAAEVSTVSGRGVGMDAVLRAIERLQGTIDIHSEPGAGTRFHISLPVNAITTRLLTVVSGGTTYGLRLDQIVETTRIDADAITMVGQGQVCMIRDRVLPVMDLAQLLGQPGETSDIARLVVTEVTGESVALRVRALGERIDAMVRARSGLLASVPAVGGTSVLADGSVLIVLDLPELLA
ncbi:chemotaxis protein CheA [Flavisphingomonas formosensis]|uniref:chemotaxis protein CheA n=1 Tax=Flavisphingomonas formosensis TaxID=861534 RepID=UPI0012FA9194|nr:ATP-binding protein [Sphingomonas formosensis]